MASHLRLLRALVCLAALVTGSAGFRVELNHPYAGSSLSDHAMFRRAARASKARVARLSARLAGDISVRLAHISDEGYTVTVGIGTPPQPHTLFVDTGSDLTWTQCKTFNHTARQREPLFDPAQSSSFGLLPCGSRLCKEDNNSGSSKYGSNNTCRYNYGYVSVGAVGVLASDTFTFGVRGDRVSLTFGSMSIIGNVQQQNLLVVFDIVNSKFSFAPARCDHI